MNRALSSTRASSGWRAHLKLGFRAGSEQTVLAQRQRTGPLSVQRPFYPEGRVCHVYVLHPPGGVVGGDEIEQDIQVDQDASALITTPGATKFYRSSGQDALVNNRLVVEGELEWLPQETIVFDQARLKQSTVVELGQNARFIGWEMICLGRPASEQWFNEGSAIFSTRIQRQGVPLLIERLPVTSSKILVGPACLRGHFFAATMLVTPANQDQRDSVLQYINGFAKDELLTVTLLEDLLVIRYLGDQPHQCRLHLEALWRILRPTVFNRNPTPPRIWNT